jgi:predicted double-glycine peptidase
MKCVRQRAGYTWTDYKTNTEIVKEINMTTVLVKIREFKRNWLQHVNKMPRNILQRILKNYRPKGRRNQRRPLKRLLDM